MRKSWLQWAAIITVPIFLCLPILTASAAKLGWATSFDPRKRVFLSFSSAKDGPRDLYLACLRDVDTFSIGSEGVVEAGSSGHKVTLTLENGNARYAIEGEVSPAPDTGVPSFSTVDIDLEPNSIHQLQKALMPVFEGKGSIQLTIGTAHRELPVSGLSDALKRFKSVCFGIR